MIKFMTLAWSLWNVELTEITYVYIQCSLEFNGTGTLETLALSTFIGVDCPPVLGFIMPQSYALISQNLYASLELFCVWRISLQADIPDLVD